MKIKNIRLKIFVSIMILLSFLYFLFINTDIFLPSTKEVENSNQLKTEIVNEIASSLSNNDTLYLATKREYGVCGNDSRFDGTTTFSERIQEIKHLLDNPFYLDLSKDFEMSNSLNGNTIIVGIIFDNNFMSEKYNFEVILDSSNQKKELYEVKDISIKKDTVIIYSYSLHKSENDKVKMEFIKVDSKWKRK
ncbi:hypothetical protein [Algibacter lectus]|uniref:Uncharacterized protein n=1 Tax=Algibacter lectus TaxID=221126 RepID=A0A090W6Z3_9FLAO|nr:hypothetical protein [Algibacter lectus]GAL63297.1 hypothetical protein JCM19300_1319 [Algibacter lectus]